MLDRSLRLKRPHVTDPQKPNVIFSSNIPLRVANCVAEMHLFLGGKTSRLVDVAPSVGELEVVLEVNSLLLRNCALTPFELVRRNLVFVANAKNPYTKVASGVGNGSAEVFDSAGFTGVWKEIFAQKSPSEVFVASFRLTLNHLTIDLAEARNMNVEFRQDEYYELLAKCDETIITEVSTYLRHRLLAELKNNTDISTDIANSNTILQELPFNELASLIKNMQSRNLFTLESSSFIDTTIEGIDSLIEKQIVFEEDDFDPSGDEIKVLHSDDSGKCTANEDEDEPVPGRTSRINSVSLEDIEEILNGSSDYELKDDIEDFNGYHGHDETNHHKTCSSIGHNEIGHFNLSHRDTNQDVASHINPNDKDTNLNDNSHEVIHVGNQNGSPKLENTSDKSLDDEKKGSAIASTAADTDQDINRNAYVGAEVEDETNFVSDIHNSRDNDRAEIDVYSQEDEDLSYEVEEINIDDYTPDHYQDDALEPCMPTKSAPLILNESSRINTPQTSPLRPGPSGLISPIHPGHVVLRQASTPEMQVRKKSSFAYITNDDNSDLQFAFRNNSDEVPSFIKENKKFKFIKVGKVQKFVSLFEEQMDKDTTITGGSNVGSRVTTRPGSPLKKGG